MNYNSSEDLNKCVAYLSTIDYNNSHASATGFFLKFSNKNDKFLVTNKHVVENKKNIVISFSTNLKEAVYGYMEYPFKNAYMHPDTTVDLCILKLTNLFFQHKSTIKNIHNKYISDKMIITENEVKKLNYIEDVIMFGAPRSIYDTSQSLSIAFKGSTATPIYKFYADKKDFLLDIPSYPGSSGSPIFLCNEEVMSDFNKTKLLGIFYMAHHDPNDENVYLHLGHAIHAWKLLEFKDII